MGEPARTSSRTIGMSSWRAGCAETRTSGSEGGSQKPIGRKTDRALRPDPYTEHPTREGKVYCAVVLDSFSRRVVGWSIDTAPTAALVTNALGMAIDRRIPPTGAIVHSDQGVQPGFKGSSQHLDGEELRRPVESTQFASWAFTQRARDSGLVPSMDSVGDCYDNAMIEAFWSRMQVELLDRQRWHTRVELANAIFEYLEVFHNRQRRHSSLGMLTPTQFENTFTVA
jgi:putative transposase